MKRIEMILLIGIFAILNCKPGSAEDPSTGESTKKAIQAKVTFVELGSVNCIPCKAMQPVMKAIEEEYGDQIKVVFYDVWKNAEPGRKYGIRLIPTQIFLDEKAIEFHRHEGFYPKEEIDKILFERGLERKAAAGKSL